MWTSLKLYWKPLSLGLTALALVWLGWHAHAVVAEAEQAQQLREQIEARTVAEERANEISREAEIKLQSLRQTNKTLAARAARETTKPDYRAVLPDAGRLLYNAACCAGASSGEPDRAVRAADAPR